MLCVCVCVCVCVYNAFFSHSSIGGPIDCFCILTIVNNVAMKMGGHISFGVEFLIFRQTPRKRIARSYGSSGFNYLRSFLTVFPSGCTHLNSHQRCTSVLYSSHLRQHFLFLIFVIIAILAGLRWHLIVVLICISSKFSDVEHLFMYLLAICMFWQNVYSDPLLIFTLDCLFSFFFLSFLLLSCMGSLYIWDINHLSDMWFANIFSHYLGCIFISLTHGSFLFSFYH